MSEPLFGILEQITKQVESRQKRFLIQLGDGERERGAISSVEYDIKNVFDCMAVELLVCYSELDLEIDQINGIVIQYHRT